VNVLSDGEVSSLLSAGFTVREVRPGVGSFLQIFLDRPSGGPEHMLWLYLCKWFIYQKDEEILSSQDDKRTIIIRTMPLLNMSVTGFEIDATNDELTLQFANGDSIAIFRDFSFAANDEMAMLFADGRHLWSYPPKS
jgi:hypothetical protein